MELKPTTLDPLNWSRLGAPLDPARWGELRAIEDPRARAEAVAGQLEALFMELMLKAMRATVPEGALAGEGLGRRTYLEMLDRQWAQLSGLPRDPRFHEALVRQILDPTGPTGSTGPAEAPTR